MSDRTLNRVFGLVFLPHVLQLCNDSPHRALNSLHAVVHPQRKQRQPNQSYEKQESKDLRPGWDFGHKAPPFCGGRSITQP